MENQELLIAQIVQFLKNELKSVQNENEREDRQQVISYLEKSEGVCLGLVNLYLYGHRIAEEPAKDKIRDDINHIRKYEEMLRNWNENTEYPVEDIAEMNRFIGYLIEPYYKKIFKISGYKEHKIDVSILQNVFSNLDPIEDTRLDKTINDLATPPIMLTKASLTNALVKLIRPKMLIVVSGLFEDHDSKLSHCISIYQKSENSKIFFYDPNRQEYTCNTIQEVADLLWHGNLCETCNLSEDNDELSFPIQCFDFSIRRFPQDAYYGYPSIEQLRMPITEIVHILSKEPDVMYGRKIFDNYTDQELIDFIKNEICSEVSKKQIINCLSYTKSTDTASCLLSNFADKLSQSNEFVLNRTINANKFYDRALEILNKHNIEINALDQQVASELFQYFPMQDANVNVKFMDVLSNHIFYPNIAETLTKFFIKDGNYLSFSFVQQMKKIIDNSDDENTPITAEEKQFIHDLMEKYEHFVRFDKLVHPFLYQQSFEHLKESSEVVATKFSFSDYTIKEIEDILSDSFCAYMLLRKMLDDAKNIPSELSEFISNKHCYFYNEEERKMLKLHDPYSIKYDGLSSKMVSDELTALNGFSDLNDVSNSISDNVSHLSVGTDDNLCLPIAETIGFLQQDQLISPFLVRNSALDAGSGASLRELPMSSLTLECRPIPDNSSLVQIIVKENNNCLPLDLTGNIQLDNEE